MAKKLKFNVPVDFAGMEVINIDMPTDALGLKYEGNNLTITDKNGADICAPVVITSGEGGKTYTGSTTIDISDANAISVHIDHDQGEGLAIGNGLKLDFDIVAKKTDIPSTDGYMLEDDWVTDFQIESGDHVGLIDAKFVGYAYNVPGDEEGETIEESDTMLNFVKQTVSDVDMLNGHYLKQQAEITVLQNDNAALASRIEQLELELALIKSAFNIENDETNTEAGE